MRLFTALLFTVASASAVGHAQDGDVAEGERASETLAPTADGPSEREDEQGGGIDDERARSHFAAGESHYAAQRFGDAAREFALAYELSRRPEMLVNLARAHERDGALRAAIADLELLLAQHPSTSYRGEAEERLARMRAELAAQEAQVERERARAASDTKRSPVESAPVHEPSRTLRAVGIALAGGALATAVVALGTGLRADNLYDALVDQCPQDRCTGDFTERRDRGLALARASTAMTFVSIALGVGAATTLLLDRRARRLHALSIELSREHAGFSLRRQF